MRAHRCALLSKILLLFGLVAVAPAMLTGQTEGYLEGGGDVSVALFSARPPRTMTVIPTGAGAWMARCARCAHIALPGTIAFHDRGELFAGGAIRLRDEAGEERSAVGSWHLRGSAGGVDVVLTLPSERYVAAVLSAEAAAGEPAASLQALAVVARTFALHGTHFHPSPGHLAAQLCDSTACQAARFGPVSQAVQDAVEATAGETLWVGEHRAEVRFSQHCGGVTEAGEAIWPNLRGAAYLRSQRDPYCVRHDAAAWHTEVSLAELEQVAVSQGWHLPGAIRSARVLDRTGSGRARRIVFVGDKGDGADVAGPALRLAIGRALGWNRIRSDLYEVAVRHGALVFDGHGHGHGVGLCQAGATEMAREGGSARQILAFYFPGTRIRVTAGDDGWHEQRVGPITVRSTKPLAPATATTILDAWALAGARWSVATEMPPPEAPAAAAGRTPVLVLSPTTELFRQQGQQPGWSLAATAGERTILQPEPVLARQHIALRSLLLHEFLHEHVEGESGAATPLWFREGLVEELAGEHEADGQMTSRTSASDAALIHPQTWAESQEGHRMARLRVHRLRERFGLPTLRQWLRSGVPAAVAGAD